MHLSDREVHWWCVNLDVSPETIAALSATLTSDERDRSARLRFDRDRQRFMVARGALRDVLGRYLGTRAGEVRFVVNTFGKPALSPDFSGDIKFNLSHAADLALIAFTVGAEVGIDLEYVREQPEHAAIAQQHFSASEVDYLNGLPRDRHAEAFLRCWTMKEAYVKARGEGLAQPWTDGSADGWSLYALHPAPGYVGALVIEGGDWRLRQYLWTPATRPALGAALV